jgi:hypothetical protein
MIPANIQPVIREAKNTRAAIKAYIRHLENYETAAAKVTLDAEQKTEAMADDGALALAINNAYEDLKTARAATEPIDPIEE